jgi:hypothetical protein
MRSRVRPERRVYNPPLPSHHLWVLPSQDASTDDSLPTKVWHFLINSPNINELVTTFTVEASQLLPLLAKLGGKILVDVILPYVVACCVGVHFVPMPRVRVRVQLAAVVVRGCAIGPLSFLGGRARLGALLTTRIATTSGRALGEGVRVAPCALTPSAHPACGVCSCF